MTLDGLSKAIEAFKHLPETASETELREAAYPTLIALQEECQQLRQDADGYPANPIRADVWMHGAMSLAPLTALFAEYLRQRGQIEYEEAARGMHCMVVLSVQGHYHHIVGPAMLARAECNERLERFDFAVALYRAVVGDFSWFVEEWEPEEALPEEPRISLECLLQSLERISALDTEADDLDVLRSLADRARVILARPEEE